MTDTKLEIILAAKDMTQKTLKTFQGRLQAITKSVFSLQGGLVTLAGGYGFGALAKSALDTASNFELMEVKLDALTKGRGKQTLEEINQWALDMPVNTLEAVNAFAMMQAMGLDPTIAKMQTLVDVSSIFGEQTMPTVARALGQMQTLGRLSAEELNQLAEAGINARKYLTQAFGMTVEELQKSKISIDEIVGAIWDGLNADYAGAAKKAQKSWKGLTATFVSYVTEIERKVMGAGLFDELKTQLDGVNQEMAEWLKTNQALINTKVPEYIERTKKALADIWSVISYDPAILEWGVVGLAVGGKKGAVLMGGAAHMMTWAENLSRALELAGQGIIDYRDIATANFKELEALVKGHEKVFFKVPRDRTDVNAAAGTSTGSVPKTVSAATATGPGVFTGPMDAHIQGYGAYNQQILKTIELQNAMAKAVADTYDIDAGMEGYDEMLQRICEQTDAVIEKTESMSSAMIDLSERTAWAMQENFSDLFFDVMRGELDGLEEYATAVLRSIQRATADYLAQLAKTALFGSDTSKSLLLAGAQALFSGATASAAPVHVGAGGTTAFRFAGGGVINEHVVGVGLRSGSSYEFGEGGQEVVMPSSRLGGSGGGQTVINNSFNIAANDAKSFEEMLTRSGRHLSGLVGSDAMRRGPLRSAIKMAAK